MNTKSIKFRLTIWYALALFISITVIFASFYLITKRALFSQTDATLIYHGNAIVEKITRQDMYLRQITAQEAFLQEFNEIPGMVVVILNASGKIISSSLNISDSNALTALYEAAINSKKPVFKNRTISASFLRFLAIPVKQNNSFLGVVLVAHPIDVIQSSLHNLLVALIIVFVILLVPTILGGHLLARKVTSPITNFSEKLKKLSSENLEERIQNPKTSDELEELADSFNNLLDRISESFKRERQFIGDVAHELKTPLSILQGNVELALSKNRPKEEYQKVLKETQIDTNKISTTLKNILDLAWSESDNFKAEKINLSKLLEELKELAVKMALQKQITVVGSIAQKIIVSGKSDKLSKALLNIIDNAIKYTPVHGTITISLAKNQSAALIKIKDTGIGIAKKDLPLIFERFYRGSKTDKTIGAGLGLAIARAIITSHRGNINIESTVGRGTTVIIHLPTT